jgi:Flp pilus assembly pilin Flp
MMRRQIICFASNDRGSAAIEYSLIAAGIAVAFLAVFLPFGGEMRELADAITAGIGAILAFPIL